MKKNILFSVGVLVALTGSALAGGVTIESTSFAQKGKEWIKAEKVVPGTVIKYVNTLANESEKEAANLVITNDIPENMVYILKSATCEGKCEITYSIDGGNTFDIPAKLKVKNEKGKEVRAEGKDYTTIKWVVKSLPSGKTNKLTYKAKLQ